MSKQQDLIKYQKIQKDLETKILNKDIDEIKQYISAHNDDIMDIYLTCGSGSKYLRSPYNKVCFNYPDLALQYQELLETTIVGDVLFSDE